MPLAIASGPSVVIRSSTSMAVQRGRAGSSVYTIHLQPSINPKVSNQDANSKNWRHDKNLITWDGLLF